MVSDQRSVVLLFFRYPLEFKLNAMALDTIKSDALGHKGSFILDLSCGPTYFSLVRLTEISESAQVIKLLHWDDARTTRLSFA